MPTPRQRHHLHPSPSVETRCSVNNIEVTTVPSPIIRRVLQRDSNDGDASNASSIPSAIVRRVKEVHNAPTTPSFAYHADAYLNINTDNLENQSIIANTATGLVSVNSDLSSVYLNSLSPKHNLKDKNCHLKRTGSVRRSDASVSSVGGRSANENGGKFDNHSVNSVGGVGRKDASVSIQNYFGITS